MIIVISGFLPLFAIVSMFPALPSIIGHFQDNPKARELVPLMVSAPGLTIAFLAPFAGFFVDRFGRLPLLLWGTFFYGIFGVAPFFLDSLTLMFVSRLLLGACEAAILTVVNTLIGDYWEDEGRRDWLFLQGIAGPVLGAVTIWVAGPATELRWNGMFLIYGVAFVIFILMKKFLFEPESHAALRNGEAGSAKTENETSSSLNSPFPAKSMTQVGLLTLFGSALYYVFIISGGLVFNEIGITEPSRISDISAIPALFIIVGALVFRILSTQDNTVQLGSFLLVLCTGLTIIGLAKSVPVLVLGLVIQQTGAGMTVVTLIAWTQTKLPYQHRGRGMGIWTACFFFGQFSSPWLVARLENLTGTVQGAFVVSGVIGLAVAAMMFLTHVKNAIQRRELA
ncbi:MFS transporter [Parahaliea maris]|nr:MFS transporter [Parahaliea maris]